MSTRTASARRAGIYCRISKDRNGETLGVQRQEQACRELADRLGWTIVDVFSDNDVSAFSARRRPHFERLLDAIKNGQLDAVVCWHVDRLYRSMRDLERVIEIADAARLPIKTVNSGDLDLSTSAGRMMARILGSVARQESEHAGERRREQYKQDAANGAWDDHGHRPFGYRRDGTPLEPEATMYRSAAADLLEGKSLRAIARDWNASGITTTLGGTTRKLKDREYVVEGKWSSTRIRRMLLNPRYAGVKVHQGKVVKGVVGNWTPLIDEDTHRRVVAELKDPSRLQVTSFEKKWVGSGVYLCGVCGATMRVSWPGGQGRKYACSAHSCVMRAGDPLDAYVENAILERLSEPNAHLLIAERGVDVGKLQDQRAGLVTKLDQLVELLDDGTLDTPKARERAAQYKTQIADIDSQLAAAARTSPTAKLLASEKLRERWEQLTPTVRGAIIAEVATVTINPAKATRGHRGFDHRYVDIQWRHE